MKSILGATIILLLTTLTAWAAAPLSAAQIRVLLTDKSFVVQYQGGTRYIIYFGNDGRISALLQQDTQSTKIRKTGSWEIRYDNALCVKYIQNTTARRKHKMKCGRLVPVQTNVFNRYDEEGNLYATYTYMGTGNLAK